MSAEMAVRAAVIAALRGDAALGAVLNGVWDGTPVQASAPYVVVGECLGIAWGTKDRAGGEVRITLTVQDRSESGGALAAMLSLIDGAVRRISGGVSSYGGPGYAVASVAMLRSRIVKGRGEIARDGGWRAVVDYRVRVLGV